MTQDLDPKTFEPAAGFKRRDVRPCCMCGEGVLKEGITFYRATVQQFVALPQNIRRAQGLEMMIGSPAVAAAMGPDENLAAAPCPPDEGLICLKCATDNAAKILFSISTCGNVV